MVKNGKATERRRGLTLPGPQARCREGLAQILADPATRGAPFGRGHLTAHPITEEHAGNKPERAEKQGRNKKASRSHAANMRPTLNTRPL